MFNKVYGVNVQSPTVLRENWKLWNLLFYPKFSKYWFHQIAHIKYWIINYLTNEASVMIWYKCKFEITVAYLMLRPSTFWKTVQKKWWDFTLKKWRLSEYVTNVIKNMLWKAPFTSMIKKWFIYHKKNQLNYFGLKIRIFDISKFKFFEKKYFYWKRFLWSKNIIC